MIEILKDKERWNEFVNSHSPGLEFSYLYEWLEVWQAGLGLEIFPLADLVEGEIKSIFPLVYDSKSKMFFSQPFGGIGGSSSTAALDSYLKFINNLIKEKSAKGIEIYPAFEQKIESIFRQNGYNTKLLTTFFCLDISSFKNFDDILMKKIGPKRRRSYRVALQKIIIKQHKPTPEIISKVYSFYKEVLEHKKEKRPLSPEIFLKIGEKLNNRLIVFLAEFGGQFIGGSFNIVFSDKITPWFIVSRPAFRNTGVNNGLYGEIIRYAKEHDFKIIDWGAALPHTKEAEIKLGFRGEPITQIRAIKYIGMGGNLKLIVKSLIFRLMNKFPLLWKLYQ